MSPSPIFRFSSSSSTSSPPSTASSMTNISTTSMITPLRELKDYLEKLEADNGLLRQENAHLHEELRKKEKMLTESHLKDVSDQLFSAFLERTFIAMGGDEVNKKCRCREHLAQSIRQVIGEIGVQKLRKVEPTFRGSNSNFPIYSSPPTSSVSSSPELAELVVPLAHHNSHLVSQSLKVSCDPLPTAIDFSTATSAFWKVGKQDKDLAHDELATLPPLIPPPPFKVENCSNQVETKNEPESSDDDDDEDEEEVDVVKLEDHHVKVEDDKISSIFKCEHCSILLLNRKELEQHLKQCKPVLHFQFSPSTLSMLSQQHQYYQHYQQQQQQQQNRFQAYTFQQQQIPKLPALPVSTAAASSAYSDQFHFSSSPGTISGHHITPPWSTSYPSTITTGYEHQISSSSAVSKFSALAALATATPTTTAATVLSPSIAIISSSSPPSLSSLSLANSTTTATSTSENGHKQSSTKNKTNFCPAKRTRYSGVGRYRCEWPDCSYTPHFLRDLRRHMFKHTGDKKHKCPATGCDFVSVWKTSLLQHQRKKHQQCTVSSSSSSNAGNTGKGHILHHLNSSSAINLL
ncbi:hypothetical protein TYRP_008993 [Tyrophagus putrescentiae]|nr:hypothetical protein TYRP_008993 [Tyrophagus putrescentiae]